ncbi:hypothetical protein GCK72_008171 [Caenorhabditis remanei]|uniref:Uncharacterized protein n=1 Tax=Caenorhabditis remanei TaxID=31234 RepID=E3MNU3_CAERE|nr:hypothetical protein GCK72_008171 [Caenorhabditis remanei]EFP06243.1 hypothetical protein CRE_06789 [Caenorhabditis remanei]KAF1759926.1 hypothetical protein GCK72_008171 [Caenorhabditis remanei]
MKVSITLCFLGLLLFLTSASAKESQQETQRIRKHENMKFSSPQRNMASGAAVGGILNSAYNVIQNGAKASAGVIEKVIVSAQTYPKFNTIGDLGNLKVPYPDAVMNNAVVRVTKTNIQHVASSPAMNFLNKVAPAVMAASVAYDAWEIFDDVKEGNRGEATRKVVTKGSAYLGGFYGAAAGSVLGTLVFPVVGTAIGAILGGIFGGVFGGLGGDVIVEILRL